MKVFILTCSGAWGGIEVYTVGLAEALHNRGHEVSIVELGNDVIGRASLELSKRIELMRIRLSKELDDVSWLELSHVLRRLKGDACVFVKGDVDAGSRSLDLLARFCFRRYIVIEQSITEMPAKTNKRHIMGLVPGFGLWWYQRLWRRYIRSIGPHRVICGSKAIRSHLIKNYRFASRKTVAIHNGIDTDQFQPSSEYRRRFRAAWGIPDEAIIFGSVGRLTEEKGYDLAIELLRQLRSTLPDRDMWLVLVGAGPLHVSLERAVKEAGLRDRVVFTGFIDRHWEAYCAFDLFILPSLTEGLPLTLLEAMACGCAPIAMAVGGVAEVITDSSLGWLVPSGDREGFFTAMRNAARCSTEDLKEMGRRARESVVSHFNGQVQYARLAELIELECGECRVGAYQNVRRIDVPNSRAVSDHLKGEDRETTVNVRSGP